MGAITSTLFKMGMDLLKSLISDDEAYLISVDNPAEKWKVDFGPVDLQRSWGVEWGETAALNRQHPVLMFLSGRAPTVTFGARLWHMSEVKIPLLNSDGDVVQKKLEALQKLGARDEKLGRPPVLFFQYGTQLGTMCVLTGVEEAYDPVHLTGQLRGVVCRLTLKKYTPYDIETPDPSAPEPMSVLVYPKEGDSYEAIARREYGNALWGVVLRQLQPDFPEPVPGVLVHCPGVQFMRTQPIRPASPVLRFREDPEQEARLRALLRARTPEGPVYYPADAPLPDEFDRAVLTDGTRALELFATGWGED